MLCRMIGWWGCLVSIGCWAGESGGWGGMSIGWGMTGQSKSAWEIGIIGEVLKQVLGIIG